MALLNARRAARRFVPWAGLLLALPAQGADLAARIDAHLAQPRFASASWGIAVVSLDDGHVVYRHDAQRLLLPASTAKLYTAAFALERLGPEARTHTDVIAAGERRRGSLHGPLVLRGRGDPTLAGNAWADALASQVEAAGIQRVDGGIVGDDTAFAGPPYGSGWEVDDLAYAYGASTGALDIDENTLTARVTGGDVSVTPADAAIAIAPQAATVPDLYRETGQATLFVLGDVSGRQKLSLPDPALTAARRLQSALARRGIRVDGEARSVRWPVAAPTGQTLASLPSPPLIDLLREGLKRSQNLYLQSVFLLTGLASDDAQKPTEERAATALARWLAAQGIGPSSATLVEGTGLSRHDLTTADALVHLLVRMDASPLAASWRNLLPVAGVDGTLARRMRDTAAMGNVRAKTGSMSFVDALAGYVTTRGGQRLAFVILLNNYRPASGAAPMAAEVDAIALMLAEATGRL
ncbi:D-alanyl-D-alanine carboxypeptidase/D-alanyl-D-alanine-endopeptidase [Luteibacter sp. PPL201]|uniref:D-alanyl-D-alanine carboxypeptidase/D-alanyl-D-alanine-endopeptidase n=1 Tax=Luteibacter sahnii TaxID=3021977 RepID=A0ABT6B8Y2_9GAMM|nr:D-alanyl-D-alanine carboxypeptidase/D-alanyl-D-alanine-endopeptidase [Luteibacter sp. PPL193]MDY1549491.1 D-alanyl-D-alanine carboxypeptidase/D-alanyl-D-alanine-endopeptidase [Luteibacter sp. PPL193]